MGKCSVVGQCSKGLRTGLALVILGASGAATAGLPVVFSKVFAPDTIGPGSTTTLVFTITNGDALPVTDLAFSDTLPVAVTIADPANASTNCPNAILVAPDGGSTITFSDANLGASSSCSVSVDVTSSTAGVHTNTSGVLTSSAGNSGSATDDLTVSTSLPGFSKSFAPNSLPLGGRSELTLLIDNSANASAVPNLDFTDNLPAGMVIASPSNASTDCGTALIPPTLTATAGGSAIVLDADGVGSFPAVAAGATCSVTVDVVSTGSGMLDNLTEDLLADFVSAGIASATLDVTVTPLAIQKSFTNDPTAPGNSVTLDFRIDNFDRIFSATGVSFGDDLSTVLPGVPDLIFTGLLSNDCGGSVTGVGTSNLNFSGGTVAPESSCSLSVSLLVPAGAALGIFTSTTSAINGTVDGSPITGNMASDDLFVQPAPILTQLFLDDTVGAGNDVVLQFSVTNTSATSGATDITFIDELTDGSSGTRPDPTSGFLPFPVSVTLPPVPDPPCGAGSSLALVFVDTDRQGLELTGGNLAAAGMAGDSCTFEVTVSIPAGFPAGTYLNTTEEITATVDGATRTGIPASDDLIVVAAPNLVKEFTDDPTAPGGTATLEFMLEHDALATADATSVAFTDDLTALVPAVAGLTAISVDSNTCTGAAVDISSSTLIDVSGGTLAPGDTCLIAVTLAVPGDATPGRKTSTTSAVTAIVDGLSATGTSAEDELRIAGLTLSKEFLNDPAIPGGSVTLRFRLDNSAGVAAATDISFSDNLGATLTGLVANGPPPTPCGGTLSGTSVLSFSGGTLGTGNVCSFDVNLDVPAMAANGDYPNVTSNLFATIDGTTGFVLDPAVDVLVVDDQLLSISKSFINDPVLPGGSVTLEFTLANLDPTRAASAIAFSDDLDAALTGLTVGMAASDTCGGTPAGSGTGLFSYTGGSLAGGASCTISVDLNVPAAPLAGNTFTNTTSTVTGTIDGLAVAAPAASDSLRVLTLVLAKSFDQIGFPDRTVDLTFTITNMDVSQGVSPLSFSDNLPAGLLATGLPAADVCGTGSTLSGTSLLTLNGGSLAAGGSCMFTVTVLVPVTAMPGTVVNTTSELFSSGLSVGGAATANLTIEAPPTFAKAFAPDSMDAGQVSTLTFTIDNGASSVAASSLSFTDNLPTGMVVAGSPNASTTCTGGTLTAAPGGNVISYSGGSVAAGSSCTLQADITSDTPASYTNTSGDLTSSSGNSGPASASLTVLVARLDLAISITNNVTEVYDLDVTDYVITVNNLITATAVGAQVNVPLPSAVASATWDCMASGAASCAASGTDAIDDTVTMPPGSMLTYTWSAAVARTVETQLDVSATVTAPMGLVDEDLSNNTAIDSDPLIEQIVFRSSFEDGEGMVMKRAAGIAWLDESLLQASGRLPSAAIRVLDDQGNTVFLVHQRLSAGQTQLRIARRSVDGGWDIGPWQTVETEGGVTVSWPQ